MGMDFSGFGNRRKNHLVRFRFVFSTFLLRFSLFFVADDDGMSLGHPHTVGESSMFV